MNDIVFYEMEKFCWNHRNGGYTDVEIQTGALTLKQVTTRMNRLKNASTLFLWSIFKYRKSSDIAGGKELLGEISAEEFEGDVPNF